MCGSLCSGTRSGPAWRLNFGLRSGNEISRETPFLALANAICYVMETEEYPRQLLFCSGETE